MKRAAILLTLAILAGCSHAPSAGSPGTTVSTPLRPGGTPINMTVQTNAQLSEEVAVLQTQLRADEATIFSLRQTLDCLKRASQYQQTIC